MVSRKPMHVSLHSVSLLLTGLLLFPVTVIICVQILFGEMKRNEHLTPPTGIVDVYVCSV
jgi:hypothetical protein